MTYGDRLLTALTHAKRERKELAKAIGRTVQAVGDVINGKTKSFTAENNAKAAAFLGISSSWLATGEGSMALPINEQSNVDMAPGVRPQKGVPVVGEVKGGDDGYLDELQYPVGYGDGTVDYPTADPHAYALRVRGDSMHPRYRAGEFIVVEPSIEAQPGDDVVVALKDGRKLLKEMNWRRDGEVQLLSVNNHFGPLTLPESDIHSIQLVAGRVRRSALTRNND